MENKKLEIRLAKVYKPSEANEAKLKFYLHERHTTDVKRTGK